MLASRGVQVAFGHVHVLRGVDFSVHSGEVVGIVGPNGSGKSTFLRTLAGLAKPFAGTMTMDGRDITSTGVWARVRMGITLVPQGRRLFGPMSVRDNLMLGAYTRRKNRRAVEADLARWLDVFPLLREKIHKQADELSGGQQQIVTVVRGLMSRPKILLLDEPSIGLAPMMVEEVEGFLRELRAQSTIGIVVVEQNLGLASRAADRVVVIKQGANEAEIEPGRLLDSGYLAKVYFE
ncbi:ABC transporter ATP-binding protein [Actinophytocola sp.]|uniref:ABC transporter ATP-binding protein n=1 Tax=Actinophytocola sp. TaxID=1872138 RepID=UPI003D6BB42D